MRGVVFAALVLAAPVALAGCGGDNSAMTGAAATSDAVVQARDVDGVGSVLVGRDGYVLYTPEQEENGQILCGTPCAAVWPPLTVTSASPSPEVDGVTGEVGTVTRPDGAIQVTVAGHPLYRF